MASEASAAEQATDKIEGNKVVDDDIDDENASQPKETGECEGIEKSKIEELAGSESIESDSKESIEDKKDETRSFESGKKENVLDEAPASGVLEDKKDDAPAIDLVKEENVELKAPISDAVENNEHNISAFEVAVKEGTEKTSISDEQETKAFDKELEEKSKVTVESQAVPRPLVESELPLVHESDQTRQEQEASKPVDQIVEAKGEPLNIFANPTISSEATTLSAEQSIVATSAKSVSDASRELENKNKVPATNEVFDASEDEKVSTIEVEASCESLKEGSDVKETKSTLTVQALDTVPGDPIKLSDGKAVGNGDDFLESNENANGYVSAGGSILETKNEENVQDATESLVKDVIVDTSLPTLSVISSECGKNDTASVIEVVEAVVKPEINVEGQKEDNTLETSMLEECQEVQAIEAKTVEDQKVEKSMATEPTVAVVKETGDLTCPPTEVIEASIEKDKPSEGGEKDAEEHEDVAGSDSTAKVIEAYLNKEKPFEGTKQVAEDLKDEKAKSDAKIIHNSGGVDLEGKTNEAGMPIKEPLGTEEAESKVIGTMEMDETKEKKGETQKSDSQPLVESSEDVARSKTSVEVQTPVKPKTLISKVKHSIVKVKKAIIGKSPSSKMISLESKDELKDE